MLTQHVYRVNDASDAYETLQRLSLQDDTTKHVLIDLPIRECEELLNKQVINNTLCLAAAINYTACADFPNVLAQRHIFGGAPPLGGAMTPKFELGRGFCTAHVPANFHHHVFTRSEVIMLTTKQRNTQTNKQTPLKHPTLFATLRRWVKMSD